MDNVKCLYHLLDKRVKIKYNSANLELFIKIGIGGKMTIKLFKKIALFAILMFLSITCSKKQEMNKVIESENKK
jgi:hypothetical protein